MSAISNQNSLPRVGIVVLNWNNYRDSAKCLESLSEIQYPNFDVYVVDNGSTDNSGKRLAEDFPWSTVIFNKENRGFATGNNKGIEKAFKDECEHILILNNDTTVTQNFLQPLVETVEGYQDIAIVSGVIRFEKTKEIQSAGRSFNPYLVRAPHFTSVSSTNPFRVEAVSGAAMLLTGEFLEEEGLLCEKFFFGMEDIEVSWRATRKGWNVMINPNSLIFHRSGGTAGSGNAFRHYHSIRARLRFALDFLPLHHRSSFLLFLFLSRTLRILQWRFSGKPELVKATLLGLYDELRGFEFRKIEDFTTP